MFERMPGGHDVEHSNGIDPLGMVQSDPVGTAGAAIVSHDAERVVAEGPHRLHLIKCEGSHGVRRVVGRARWNAAVSVSTKVARDHSKGRGELRRDSVPHEMSLRYP